MARRKKKRKQAAPGWAWMLFGLSIGLAIALVVYLRGDGPMLAEPPQSARTTPVSVAPVAVQAAPAPAEPAPLATAAATTTADATMDDDSSSAADLGFYQQLGEQEVEIPASEMLARDTEVSEYTIQAGSFSTLEEADRHKARLALLGIESSIARTIVGDAIWFRVIVGPLSERGTINSVRRRLRSANIDSMPPQPVPGN